MKTFSSAAAIAAVAAVLLTGCSSPAPAPTVTVTVTPTPDASDSWQRFREDPAQAFVFASAYEIIWGYPIGNGELAESAVSLADTMCDLVEGGTYTWENVGEGIDVPDIDNYVLTAQVFCPEVK